MHMKKSEIAVSSLWNAVGVLLYVLFVSQVLANGERLFGSGKSAVIPVFMLLLLIVSATVTGTLVLGKPILLYLDGRKKESVVQLAMTVGWLTLFLAGAAGIMMLTR